MESDFREYLKDLRKDCHFVPLGKGEEYKHSGRRWINPKRPINDDWRNDTFSLEEVCKIKKTGIGIVQGVKANGVLCTDMVRSSFKTTLRSRNFDTFDLRVKL